MQYIRAEPRGNAERAFPSPPPNAREGERRGPPCSKTAPIPRGRRGSKSIPSARRVLRSLSCADARPRCADICPPAADGRPERADMRPRNADARPECADMRPRRADARPEPADMRPQRADACPAPVFAGFSAGPPRAWGIKAVFAPGAAPSRSMANPKPGGLPSKKSGPSLGLGRAARIKNGIHSQWMPQFSRLALLLLPPIPSYRIRLSGSGNI